MPKITIYNDSDSDLDADFDVLELRDGKEVTRTTMRPSNDSAKGFRLYASNQAFLIVPRGAPCPAIEGLPGRHQIDAKPRKEK